MTPLKAKYNSHFLLGPAPSLAWKHSNTTQNAGVLNYTERKTIRSHVARSQHFAGFRAAPCSKMELRANNTQSQYHLSNYAPSKLHGIRRSYHPKVYMSVGSPTLFRNFAGRYFVAHQISISIHTASAIAAPAGIASHQCDISVSLLREYGVRSCPNHQASGLCEGRVRTSEQLFGWISPRQIPRNSGASSASFGRSSRRSIWPNVSASASATPSTSLTASASLMRARLSLSTRKYSTDRRVS